MRRVWFWLPLLAWSVLPVQAVSTAARQQDLTYISTQLPKLHPNFFFQLDPAQFQQAVSALNAKVSTATDAEFYVGLAQLVAMAGDAHTSLSLQGSVSPSLGFLTLPLTFIWLDDGVFVTGAAPAYSRAIGNRLVAVAGMPIDQVIQQLTTVISHGNDQWVHHVAQQYLAGQQILQGLHIAPVTNATPMTFQTPAGDQFTLQVQPTVPGTITMPDPAAGALPAWIQNSVANYWFSYSAANRLLYFRYNRCTDDPGNPMANVAAAALAVIDQNPLDTFVLDIRDNGGGADTVITPLTLGLQQRLPALLTNPRLHIYVPINKGTFSSGMDTAMNSKVPLPTDFTALFPNFDFSHLVQLIGEPTGGKPAEYGEVLPFTLPGSAVLGQCSTMYFPNPSYIPDLPSVMPDIAVGMRSTDYFARHDPVLAAILARTQALPAAPTGSAIAVNGATFRADQGMAPGSFASVFGAFSTTPDQVLVGGAAATIVAAAASQVNFVVPRTIAAGSAVISVRAHGQEIAQGQATITPAGPGIFVLDGTDPAQPGAVENQDYGVNSSTKPAPAGSVVQIFATGFGPLNSDGSAAVQVFFNDIPGQVLYSAPIAQYPGLWQINAQVPAGVKGQVALEIVAGNLSSNGVTVYVQ
jgi:uncharacterized protein (TIGR03437 family)